jgi:hypothetical protein
MHQLLRITLLSALALEAQAQAVKADAAKPGVKGKEIIQQAVEALGGQKFLEMQDRVESGRAYSFYRERLSGLSRAKIYTRYLNAPGPGELAIRERQAFGKDEDSAVLFREDEAWDVTYRGARPLGDDVRDRHRETTLRNIFYILRNRLEEKGMTFDYMGVDRYEGQPVDVVDIADSNNRVTEVFFSQSSHLPVRQLTIRRNQQTKERFEEVTIFSKYRDVGGGVQWPFLIERTRNGEKIFEMYADTVEINSGLADNLFTLPSNIKQLKPAR